MERYLSGIIEDINKMAVIKIGEENTEYIKKEDVKFLINTDYILETTIDNLIRRATRNMMRSIPIWKCPYSDIEVKDRPCKQFKNNITACEECRNAYELTYKNKLIKRYVGEEYMEGEDEK